MRLRWRIFTALLVVQVMLGGGLALRVEASWHDALELRHAAEEARAGSSEASVEALERAKEAASHSVWGNTLALLALGAALSALVAEFIAAPLRRAAQRSGHLGVSVQEALALQAEALARAKADTTALASRRQASLDASPDGLVLLDQDQGLEAVNEQALRLLGVPEAEVAEHPALSQGGHIELGGAKLELTRHPVREGGWLVRIQDVTELRRLESVRQDFVSNVSHELRTPVSVIRTNIEALQGGALEEPELAVSFVEAIGRNAERLGALIADLLSLASLDGGERLELVPVDAGQVAWRVKESLNETADARGQLIHLRIEPGTLVQADPGGLEQVLTNLVENAIKYGSERGRVELRSRPAGRGLRLEVHDDGPGVPEAHRKRVFERFYRVDKGRSRRMGGTGLGLSIVRHLATAMGGEVGVGSSDLGGACFWVELRRP